ncbi:hypothetical protein NQ317_002363 [Molorchus minor]|uniref:Tubulin-specific chaperone A n=1 Tax=Molorchus minor TaxID=1323400 RepID=A0ABQ9JUN8_9CUCU|nr:hypothetical protein NQ317_002363 [Molorchus minor]
MVINFTDVSSFSDGPLLSFLLRKEWMSTTSCKQEEVLTEALMMVPDCQRRLATAFEDLQKILNTEEDLKEIEDYLAAKKVLEEAKLQLPKSGEVHMC